MSENVERINPVDPEGIKPVGYDEAFNFVLDSYSKVPAPRNFGERARMEWDTVERMYDLGGQFQKRKNSVVQYIRSVNSNNVESITVESIVRSMKEYEAQLEGNGHARSNLSGFFESNKPEVLHTEDGLSYIVK